MWGLWWNADHVDHALAYDVEPQLANPPQWMSFMLNFENSRKALKVIISVLLGRSLPNILLGSVAWLTS